MQFLLRSAALVLLLAPLAVIQAQDDNPFTGFSGELAEMRTWTDSTGQHKVEAKLLKFENNQVTLEKADGRFVTLPLARLSEADQTLLESLTAKPPAPATTKAVGVGESVADWSAVRNVTLDPPARWSLPAEKPLAPPKPLARGAVAMGPIGDKNQFFESVSVVGFDEARGHAILSRVINPPGDKKTVWIERCDLVAGRSLGVFELPSDVKALDVDPTGTRLAARQDVFGFGKNGRVDVWDISGLSPTVIASWEPYSTAKGAAKDVAKAMFLDAERMLTTGNGSLTLWHLPTLKAVYTIPIKGGATISDGRKYVAFESKDGMFVVDAATGDALAQLQGDTGPFMKFAFHPEARRLAMISRGRLQVWDCESGERVRDIFLTGITNSSEAEWVGDTYVLVNKSLVIDIERRMVLWRYDGMSNPGETYDGKYWFMVGGGPHGKSLMQVEIPHREAIDAVAAIAPDDLLAVRPGVKMRLEVRLGFSGQHKQQIIEALTARLSENGVTVANNAPLVFTATAERGEKKSITYRSIGFGSRGNNTVEVQQNKYSMAIQENGQDLWRNGSMTSAPPFLHLEDGQTVQQAVDKFSALNLGFFLKTPVPRLLARPGKHGGAYGVSRVTAAGMQTTHRP